MKYVRLMDDTIVVGPENSQHRDLANNQPVKSAGHFRSENGTIALYGKSYGYNKRPRSGDARLIGEHLRKK